MKLDRVKNLSLDENQKEMNMKNGLSEEELLEMRLGLMKRQDELKMQSNAELLKTLKDLQKSIKDSVADVQKAANEVRAYPVEVVTRVTEHVEQSLARMRDAARSSEQAAGKAKELYEAATISIERNWREHLIWMGIASLNAALITAALFIWIGNYFDF